MKFIIIDNKENKQIIKKRKLVSEDLLKVIEEYYFKYTNEQAYKIKLAHQLSYKDKLIKEFKIHYNNRYYRIGYIEEVDVVLIVLISEEIVKEKFVKQLKKVKEVK